MSCVCVCYRMCCSGFLKWQDNVDLGSWERGEEYGEDIIQVSAMYMYLIKQKVELTCMNTKFD